MSHMPSPEAAALNRVRALYRRAYDRFIMTDSRELIAQRHAEMEAAMRDFDAALIASTPLSTAELCFRELPRVERRMELVELCAWHKNDASLTPQERAARDEDADLQVASEVDRRRAGYRPLGE